jgi:hypothetical protein
MKVIFLVIASEDPVHEHDLKTQRETWAKNLPEDFQVVYLRGSDKQQVEFRDGTLYVACPELYGNILQKTILGIRYLIENFDFDILIRTNVSTYFNLERLRVELTKERYAKKFFGGYIDRTKGGYFGELASLEYISGTGIFLSRTAADGLSALDYRTYRNIPDDVAISNLLEGMAIRKIRMTRNNLGSTHIFVPSYYIRAKSSAVSELASARMRLIDSYFAQNTFIRTFRAYLVIFRLEFHAFWVHPEPKIRYLQRNRIVLQSFFVAKGAQLWQLLIRRS